jgi:hypothetical protein
MAKKNPAAAAVNGQQTMSTPDGMVRTSSVANAPWWHLKAGTGVYGRLLNMYERPDERAKSGKSKFFQIELLEWVDKESGEVHDYYFDPKNGTEVPTEVRIGRGKGATFEVVPMGTIINVNYGPKTKDWEPLVQDIYRGAEYRVLALITGEKFEIRNAQTMWPIDTFHEQVKPPRPVAEPDFDDEGDDGDAAGAPAGAP